MKNMYMVRAGSKSYLIDKFESEEIVAVDFNLPDLSNVTSQEELRSIADNHFTEKSKVQIGLIVGMVWRFKNEFNIGDYVISYDSQNRLYLIGKIKSEYKYCPKFDKSPHIRKVEWISKIDRDNLKPSTKNTLGSLLSIFKLNKEVKEEFLALLKGNSSKKE